MALGGYIYFQGRGPGVTYPTIYRLDPTSPGADPVELVAPDPANERLFYGRSSPANDVFQQGSGSVPPTAAGTYRYTNDDGVSSPPVLSAGGAWWAPSRDNTKWFFISPSDSHVHQINNDGTSESAVGAITGYPIGEDDDASHLFVLSGDEVKAVPFGGGSIVTVTSTSGSVSEAIVSPDGTRLLTFQDSDYHVRLYALSGITLGSLLYETDGSHEESMLDSRLSSTWAPDSSAFGMVRWNPPTYDATKVVTIDRDGAQIGQADGELSGVSFSPDSQFVVYGISPPETSGEANTDILISPVDFSSTTVLLSGADRAAWGHLDSYAHWMGETAPPPEPTPSSPGLEFHITGLWYPEETTVAYYGRIADPQDGEVFIPLNDSRTASVTVRLDDKVIDELLGKTYQRFLKVYHDKNLVFWGPAKLHEVDMDAGTCKVSAVDCSLRLIRHQLRRGDLVDAPLPLSAPRDQGAVTVDATGLRHLRDAGLNTTDQTTRGVPDLGIIDGTNSFGADPDSRLGVSRADEVWAKMRELSESLGPDFELEPIEDTVGAYAQLNTYSRQGADRSATVQFHYGTGLCNLENLTYTDGSEYTTHVHIQPRDGGAVDNDVDYRFTEANVDSSADTGPYVDWISSDYDAQQVDEDEVEAVLRAYARDRLKAYGRPLLALVMTCQVEDGTTTQFRYGRDYDVGDTVGAGGKAGRAVLETAPYRIVAVRLKQEAALCRPELTVVADRAAADDTIDTED